MENSKVKALFVTQYWGQKVFRVSDTATVSQYVDGFFIDRFLEPSYLLLRTVDQLTDEECIEVAKIVGYEKYKLKINTNNNLFARVDIEGNFQLAIDKRCAWIMVYDHNPMVTEKVNLRPLLVYQAYQYLLNRGIILPFTYIDENGKPQTLQPDEIIKLGWAKTQQP